MTTDRGRICWQCDEPIQSADEVVLADVFSNSGAGASIELHRTCPVAPSPRQTAPVGWGARSDRVAPPSQN
jgi:hypothetical protein